MALILSWEEDLEEVGCSMEVVSTMPMGEVVDSRDSGKEVKRVSRSEDSQLPYGRDVSP